MSRLVRARHGRKKKPKPGNPFDPRGLAVRLSEYLAWMETRNYSPSTRWNADRNIGYFVSWADERGLTQPEHITRTVLETYARFLFERKTAQGRPLSFMTQYQRLSHLRCFFRFLARREVVAFSPAQDLELPRLGHRLPRSVLTHEEMETVLSQPDVTTLAGLRDRALMELLYSTGLRRSEVVRLSVFDVDAGRRTVLVVQGKGKKDRFVPVGRRALDWLERYLVVVRPQFSVDAEDKTLFLTAYGLPLSVSGLTHAVSRYIRSAQVGKQGSCHLFRHTMATLLLEGGVDVRLIQEILGHSSLDATQVYTQVSIHHLVAVHAASHPAERAEQAESAERDVALAKAPGADLE